MKKFFLFVFLILTFSLPTNIFMQNKGANLRGLINTYSHSLNKNIPLQSARVDLYVVDNSGQNANKIVVKTTTNQSGYYYFYNIPDGKYYILVNGVKNYPFTIDSKRANALFLELPPLNF